jgi:chromosomal replication initiation ATPase DnaA
VLVDRAFKARISKKPWKNVTTKKLKQELAKLQTMQVITKKIAVKYQLTPNELRVSIREQQNLPRQIAIYHCQQNLDVILQLIADYFGMNHKSAVNQQVRRLKFMMEEDTALREEVAVLCQYLTH